MPRVDISAEPLFSVGPLVVTNSMVGAVLASLILLLSALVFVRRAQLVPDRVQGLIELPLEWVAGMVSSGGGTRWRSYVGLVIGIFVFVLVANWLGLLPGVGTIGIVHHTEEGTELVPIVRPASADLNFTLGLAIVSFVAFTGIGIRANGVRRYLRHLLIAEPWWMTPIVTPIHLVSEFARLISLSIRLFGNVYAGEALLAIMAALVPLALPVVFLGLEMLFGFVQALVFALLTMAYVILAIAEDQGHEDGHHDDGPSGQGRELPVAT
jgi:F-type H+-transporting ATPase subunit a